MECIVELLRFLLYEKISVDSKQYFFITEWKFFHQHEENREIFINSRLIFSAGYYSAPIFFLLRRKKFFALPHFAAFSWTESV